MNYLEMLEQERPYNSPAFARVEQIAKDPNPVKPRNWPMAGESFIRGETSRARVALEGALASQPKCIAAWGRLSRRNIASGNLGQPEGVIVIELAGTLVQVERKDERLIIVTVNTEDARLAVRRQRKRSGDMGRSLEGSSYYYGSESFFEYPIAEYIKLHRLDGLQYLGPAVHRIPKPGILADYRGNNRLPQQNTTAARDGIMDFARRLRLGNLLG